MLRASHYLTLTVASLLVVGCSHQVALQTHNAVPAAAPKPQKPRLTKLVIKDVKIGKGGEFGVPYTTQLGDRLYVQYTGKLADGTVFDSNTAGGKPVFAFTIGEHEVVKGWEQGLLGMKVGGERTLEIPASLGYGSRRMGTTIPADSDLYFDVKLLDDVPYGHENDEMINDVKPGTGPAVAKGKQISVTYTISDLAGNEMNSTNGQPYTWVVGNGKVYQSIEDGVAGMKQGGVRDVLLGPALEMRGASKADLLRQAEPQIIRIKLLKVKG